MMAGYQYQFPEHPEKIEAALVNAVLQAAREVRDGATSIMGEEVERLVNALSALDAWADQERKA